ncbi:MAG: ATP-dependent protease ATPase subunit HslU [Thermotoga sp. 50_1627]|uniref:ATP-dependent protease ATPase subunit HslU n=1 Tax=Pseudothermotoga sp. TaxID=2033661 RepID=UPI00076CBBF1|nr:MAG: ATP-dependent protease ATPase subunit HslU [Thermotoga sp. 50_64]KUK25039.1 MAG: ATP-dependent protease ATPase subunit HslU [Thermotoga sp. 50_1627]MBC7116387.1 ATP-dependent protease ATPase subunit HslU [Pseudothermotoga sp.]HBT39826.1 HslU--HslV peptidase ATPase subunit [Pseudothermotoga sp.]HCO97985.1 HslU--HslV peptidase ATPase subunit [Pseudothermotoga sp.]
MTNFDELTPKQIVAELDKYIVGQHQAKRAVAIAIRNRIRRQKLPEKWQKEVLPKNILMIGPTGVGKTEIARRLAQLSGSPFLKVEATRFTEIGYVGKNVESMIRDLVEISVNMVKKEMMEQVREKAEAMVEERILDALVPESRKPQSLGLMGLFGMQQQPQQSVEERRLIRQKREEMRQKLRSGELENEMIEIEVEKEATPFMGIVGSAELEDLGIDLSNMLGSLLPKTKQKKRLTVSEARKVLLPIEAEKLLDVDKVVQEALDRAQNRGIIFIDELDKIAIKSSASGPDVSRQGVQRDLLPIVEGTTIMTKYGPVRTDYILFIGSGAFHMSRPSDLMPELQGRFPIRVELSPLTQKDFVRILTEPENAIIKQYQALLAVEGVELVFSEDGVEEIARIAYELNQRLENIGARRLYTVVEKVLEDIAFEAPDVSEKRIVVDANYVREKIGAIAADEDLSSYIL